MDEKDFFGTEASITTDKALNVKIEFVGTDGNVTVLKKN